MRPLSLSALALLAVAAPSCTLLHPRQGADIYGQQPASANPYGEVPQSNPYATPPASTYGQPAAAANPYSSNPYTSNPYTTPPASGNAYGGYEQPQTYSEPSTPSRNSYSGGGGEVTVQPGDNLTKIARRNNTTVSALKTANGLTSDMIRAGQKLNLP